ncbi:MAG TPA: methyltransferase domain-containing protein [Candidatus Acidoferrales bacterium]|nr:methyltransferase domain-containing protein [Candidatus Acidoferrales bacterium]
MELMATLQAPRTPQQLQAMESYRRRDYQAAIAQFRQALETTQSAECWSDLGCSQFALGLSRDAEASFRRAVLLDKSYAMAAQNLAALLISQKQFADALDVLLRAHRLAKPSDRATLAPLIQHCVKQSRALTQPAFQTGARLPKVVCLVAGFLERGTTEANAREAWNLYESLRELSGEVEASFLSIETSIATPVFDPQREIYGVPASEIAGFIREKSPDLLQVHYPLLNFPVQYSLQRQPTTLTLTCSDPLEGCHPETLDEVRHLIDFGRLTIVCQSAGTLARLQAHGIRVAAVIPPVMSAPPRRTPSAKQRANFVVGFATAPIVPEHWQTRGVPLLLDLAAHSPESHFLLAWRTSPDEIQKAVAAKGLTNVTVLAGNLDMEAFYDQIDAVILPFGAAWGNHGCPLSSVEGMLRGKPVLATEFVGIAEWLQATGAGVVVPPSGQGLRTGLVRLQNELAEFSRQSRLASRSHFDRATSVNAYRKLHAEALEKHKGPTLRDWENRLEATGKILVRGRPSLANYYQSRPVAQRYIDDRFASEPFRRFAEEEHDAIRRLIADRFGGRTDLALLDFATGPGRLLPCLVPFGITTALDGSAEMLEVARQSNASGIRFVHGDVFSHSLLEKFHVVTCGRLLRHFEYPDRRLLYRRFHELLREDGIAIVDVPNPAPEYQTRDNIGWENYGVYDVFWTLDQFRDELRENNLRLFSFASVGAHLSPAFQASSATEPFEFIVAFGKAQ